MLILDVTGGPDEGKTFKLPDDAGASKHLIGRTLGVVQLNDDLVSRRHAEIKLNSDGWQIHDLGSRNGTFVNEQLVSSPATLRDGDLIGIGNSRLKFARCDEEPAQALMSFRSMLAGMAAGPDVGDTIDVNGDAHGNAEADAAAVSTGPVIDPEQRQLLEHIAEQLDTLHTRFRGFDDAYGEALEKRLDATIERHLKKLNGSRDQGGEAKDQPTHQELIAELRGAFADSFEQRMQSWFERVLEAVRVDPTAELRSTLADVTLRLEQLAARSARAEDVRRVVELIEQQQQERPSDEKANELLETIAAQLRSLSAADAAQAQTAEAERASLIAAVRDAVAASTPSVNVQQAEVDLTSLEQSIAAKIDERAEQIVARLAARESQPSQPLDAAALAEQIAAKLSAQQSQPPTIDESKLAADLAAQIASQLDAPAQPAVDSTELAEQIAAKLTAALPGALPSATNEPTPVEVDADALALALSPIVEQMLARQTAGINEHVDQAAANLATRKQHLLLAKAIKRLATGDELTHHVGRLARAIAELPSKRDQRRATRRVLKALRDDDGAAALEQVVQQILDLES